MSTEITPTVKKEQKTDVHVQGGPSDAVYGLGLIGAWIYYIGQAKTFQEGVIGFFKGFVWPAILIYRIFQLLEKKE